VGMGGMKGQTNKQILQSQLQRGLRKGMTDAEIRLWRCLRGKQMDGHKFRRQHPFGDYILDFVCVEAKLVVEIDGGQHVTSMEKDVARTASLQKAGFRVLRFWNDQVLKNVEDVKSAIWEALHTPPPS
jgi:very-short-patch-repair endonuclease